MNDIKMYSPDVIINKNAVFISFSRKVLFILSQVFFIDRESMSIHFHVIFFTYIYSEKSSHYIQLVQKLILRIEAILTKTIKMKWVYPFPLWHSCRMDLIFQLISFSCIFKRNLLKAYHCLFHLNNRSGHCFGCLLFGWYLSAKLNNP